MGFFLIMLFFALTYVVLLLLMHIEDNMRDKK